MSGLLLDPGSALALQGMLDERRKAVAPVAPLPTGIVGAQTPGSWLVKTDNTTPASVMAGKRVDYTGGTDVDHGAIWVREMNGATLAANKYYHATYAGIETRSGVTRGVYLVREMGGSLNANYIGETVFGAYEGGGGFTTSGGANGAGYTDAKVYYDGSLFQIFRLQNNPTTSDRNSIGWALQSVSNGWQVPMPFSGLCRFVGKRGPLISSGYPEIYECTSYQLMPFTFPVRAWYYPTTGLRWRTLVNPNDYQAAMFPGYTNPLGPERYMKVTQVIYNPTLTTSPQSATINITPTPYRSGTEFVCTISFAEHFGYRIVSAYPMFSSSENFAG